MGIAALLAALACTQPVHGAPAPRPPLAESLSGDAKKAYSAAIVLFKERDFRGASLKFEEAYAASKDPRLLWNMAACERERHKHARTLELLDRYVTEGADLVTEDDRARVEGLRREVGSLVAKLSVTSEPAGATVFVDGVKIGTAPLEQPVAIDVGVHEIRLELSGYVVIDRSEDVPSGDAQLTFKLSPISMSGALAVLAPDSASVSVDGKPRGKGRWQGELTPGKHVVLVSQDGKVARETTVVIATGKTETLSITLEDPPPLVPVWAWILGASALAGGTAVGAYFLFRPQPAEPTPSTLGSFTFSATWAIP